MTEAEKINAAQKELDLRKANLMLDKIEALEKLLASKETVKFLDDLKAIQQGCVEGGTMTAINSIISSFTMVGMHTTFEKQNYMTIANPVQPSPSLVSPVTVVE